LSQEIENKRPPLIFHRVHIAALLFLAVAGAGLMGAAAEPGAGSTAAEWPKVVAAFANPPAEFRLIQYGTHDGAALPMARMAEAGIGGVMLFMQSHGYLRSDDAWRNLEANIRAARTAGLQVWVGDDTGYPSGMAGGLVVEEHPEAESRCLVAVCREGTGPGPAHLDLPATAERFVHACIYPLVDGRPAFDRGRPATVSGQRIESEGLEGPWRLCGFALQLNREGTQASMTISGFGHNGRYPNLLDATAMATFTGLTHEAYARRLGSLADTIDVFYTNEPNLMTSWFLPGARPGGVVFVPWHEDLPRRFQAEHGYDLLPVLPALFGGDDAVSRLARRHFYETVGTLLAENFPRRITEWAKGQGVRSAGHPLLEESMVHHVAGYGDFFRFVSELDIPACDLPMPDRGQAWNFWMPRFLSSVAQARGRATVAALLDPIINRPVAQLVPPPADVRRFTGMAALCGVNQFATYILWHQYDPAVYRGVNEYVGRLSAVLRGATSAATVAVYYPIESFQAAFVPSASTLQGEAWERVAERGSRQDTMAQALVTHGIDFTWVHGDWIGDGRVEQGHLVAAGGRYSVIVMPEVEVLPLPVARKLAEFEAGGGRILWMATLPTMGDFPDENAAVREMFAGRSVVAPGDVIPALGKVAPPGFAVAVDDLQPGVFMAKFVRDGRRITFLVNDGLEPARATVRTTAGEGLTADVFDPLAGTVTPVQVPGILSVEPCSSLLIVER
jgi:hypothetical protein